MDTLGGQGNEYDLLDTKPMSIPELEEALSRYDDRNQNKEKQ